MNKHQELPVSPVQTVQVVGALKVSARAYLSTHHLYNARHQSKLAKEAEDRAIAERVAFCPEHRSYDLSTINASVCFLEAAINELLEDCAEKRMLAGIEPKTKQPLAAYWRSHRALRPSTFEKYGEALKATGATPPRGKEPWQSADLLVKLRNLLTHYKPEDVGADSEPKTSSRPRAMTTSARIVTKLAKKFAHSPLLEGTGNPIYPDRLLSADCARWSVDAAQRFTDAFFQELNYTPNYQAITLQRLPKTT